MKKSAILILLIAFIIGIITAHLISIHWIIVFTCWTTSIFSLMIISTSGKQILFFRKWITWNYTIVFFLSGMLGYAFKQPASYANEFSKNYLKNDQLIGEIIEYQEGNGDYDKAIIEIQKVVGVFKETEVQGKVLCYIRSHEKALSEGHIVLLQPSIQDIKNKNNPGEFNAEQYWRLKGISKIAFVPEETIQIIDQKSTFSSFWKRSRDHLIHIIKKYINEETQGIVIALCLGDKSNLSIEKRNHFANAGAMHVLAVSGMHVGILLWVIRQIFEKIKILRKRNLYLYFALAALWCFAFLTGMTASVVRAVTMFSILGLGQIMGKRFFGLHAIFSSGLILLIFNPLFIFDIGFQLSYLAVIGIGLFYQPILNLYTSSSKIINWFWQGTAIGFAAQVGTVPLSLLYFHQFPNYFILTNIGMLILAFSAFIGGLVLLVLHFIPLLIDAIAYVVNLIFDVFNFFITWINTLPGEVSTGFTPSLTHIVLIYFFMLFTLFQWQKGKIKYSKIGILSIFILLLGLVFDRENNKSRNELVVLNHYEKVILLKDKRMLFLLYDGEKRPTLSSLDYLTKGYENAVGVVAQKVPLPKNMKVNFSEDIWIQNEKNGIKINYYGKQYFMAERLNKNILNSNYTILKGDWNPYLPDQNVNIHTKDGAFIAYAHHP